LRWRVCIIVLYVTSVFSAGCDDAVAILLALKSPDIEIVAITSVYGNVKLTQATGQTETR
jgi:inosine-uridine nucleoside N-ribohydrolase